MILHQLFSLGANKIVFSSRKNVFLSNLYCNYLIDNSLI
jgi:hypothetical protein